MSEVKVGDVVYLNSGSPALTVTEVRDDLVWVKWIDGCVVQVMAIPPACLLTTAP